MTDSMKFGPEWLRNMSVESAVNTAAGIHATHVDSAGGLISNKICQRVMPAVYRYGREEMLSFYEKNALGSPEILPLYKNLFSVKLQSPLALTSSAEEEFFSSAPSSLTRSSWMNRFGMNSSRVGGRVSSSERGRTRSKPSFLTGYRITSTGPEEVPTPDLICSKVDKSWNERNGIHGTAGDWANNQSVSTRKEGSTTRNVENWRSSRTEDAFMSNENTSVSDGWRNSSTCFKAQQKLGRNISWRDDDHSNSPNETTNFTPDKQHAAPSTTETFSKNRAELYTTSDMQVSRQPIAQRGKVGYADVDEALPEWAIDNPLEMGGCFDSSGAFHGISRTPSGTISEMNQKGRISPNIMLKSTSQESLQIEENTQQKVISVESETGAINDQHRCSIASSEISCDDASSNHVNELPHTECHSPANKKLIGSAFSGNAVLTQNDLNCIMEISTSVEKLLMDEQYYNLNTNQHINTIAPKEKFLESDAYMLNASCLPKIFAQNFQYPTRALDYNSSSQSGVEEKQLHIFSNVPVPGTDKEPQTALPAPHNPRNSREMWYYKDPQANVQGPFTSIEMADWYRSGYFSENLMLRRVCDDQFITLRELTKICQGNVPFTSDPLMPTPHQFDVIHLEQRFKEKHQQLIEITEIANLIMADIKCNVPAIDLSHVLHMRLQLQQQQYLQVQERQVIESMSSTDCFRMLSPSDRDTLIRQKVQALTLPSFLQNFSSYSNCLQQLNPAVFTQLCAALAEVINKNPYVIGDGRQLLQRLVQTPYTKPSNEYILANTHALQQQSLSPNFIAANNFPVFSESAISQTIGESGILDVYNNERFRQNNLTANYIAGIKRENEDGELVWPSTYVERRQNYEQQQMHASSASHKKQHPEETAAGLPSLDHKAFSSVNLLENATISPWPLSELENSSARDCANANSSKLRSNPNITSTNCDEKNLASTPEPVADSPTKCLHNDVLLSFENVSKENYNHCAVYNNPHMPTVKDSHSYESNVLIESADRDTYSNSEIDGNRLNKLPPGESIDRRGKVLSLENQCQQQYEIENSNKNQSQMQENLSSGSPANSENSYAIDGGHQVARNLKSSSVAPWSLHKSAARHNAPTLPEIQKAERKERRADQQRLQEHFEKQHRSNILENTNVPKWQSPTPTYPVLSMPDIQAEAKRISTQQVQRNEKPQRPNIGACTLKKQSAASNEVNMFWKNSNKVWNNLSAAGFWEDVPSKIVDARKKTADNGTINAVTIPSSINSPTANVTGVSKFQKKLGQCEKSNKTVANKGVVKSLDTVKSKIAEYESEFKDWCMQSLSVMTANIDVPTFVGFLQDLETPYDVREYVRMYLGENKESADFAKQFLDRRNKYKNLQRAETAHNDDMCKPAPAITPSGVDNSDIKNKQKKMKKNRMTKLDGRILGFSVTAAEGRLNVGDRDYADGS